MVAIKLGLSENGLAPAFYRRIKVDSLNQTGITLLKRQAVLLFQGNENGDVAAVDLDSFAVTLFYVDGDGDKVLIATRQDLLEAIEENGHVRAAIKVHATVTVPASTKSTQTFGAAETGNVVDAFSDLIQSVAVTAQAGVQAAATQAKQAHREQQGLQSKKVHKAQMHLAKQVSKEQFKAVKRQSKENYKAMKASASSSKEALQKTMHAAAQPKTVVETDRSQETKEATPFIHGRHTCDLCLTSPIIGKRFHATNLPDYDMCGTCHENYKGSDITFQEMVLDRDSSMQDRWARKYHRMVQINNGKSCRRGAGPRRSPRGHGPPPFGGPGRRFGPPPHGHGPPHPPPFHHSFGVHGPPPPFAPPHGPPPPAAGPYVNPSTETSWDAALAEAVRRSLEDENKTKEAPVKEKPSVSRSHSATSDDSAAVAAALGKVAADAAFAFSRFLEESTESSRKVAAVQVETVQDDEDVEESPVAPVKQEEPKEETAEVEEVAAVEQEAAVEEKPVAEETAEEVTVEEAVQDVAEEVQDVVSDPAEVHEASVASVPETETCEQEKIQQPTDSFSSDAMDSGSVAAFMGATLDRFSEAIDSLNSEMNGATIVDGETNEDDQDDDSSKDSWSVVEDEQISQDEHLARAAVMIGSALFNSDNNVAASQAAASQASESQISSITSAPSEVPSMLTRVSQAQMDRWSAQLKQFHEMGLDDDAKHVEVMEMLAAANIGSGQEDEITVEQVLDHST